MRLARLLLAVLLLSTSEPAHALSCGSEVGGAWDGFENVPLDAHLWLHTCSWPEMGSRPAFGPTLSAEPAQLAPGRVALVLRTAKDRVALTGAIKTFASTPPLHEIVPSAALAANTAYELVTYEGVAEQARPFERVAVRFTTGQRSGRATAFEDWTPPAMRREEQNKLGRYAWTQEWLQVSKVNGSLPLVRTSGDAGGAFRVFYVTARGEITSGVACSCQASFGADEQGRWELGLEPVSARGEPGAAFAWKGRWDGEKLRTSGLGSTAIALIFLAVLAALSLLVASRRRRPA
jgi:hypothetical protein